MITALTADLGGTKTYLQLSKIQDSSISVIKKNQYESDAFESFESMLQLFIAEEENIDFACIAIAGPINNVKEAQIANVTNLPWEINNLILAQQFSIANVSFINDFAAIGHALIQLGNEDYLILQEGTPNNTAPKAVIGAGTGLGQAILVPSEIDYTIIATEGGHTDFAPTNQMELALYQYLSTQFEHVSYERILSGDGIENLFKFLLHICQQSHHPNHREILSHTDPAAEISKHAIENTNEMAVKTMDLFMAIYGSQAGNLALNCLPKNGLYIAGGIAAKNKWYLQNSQFVQRFNAKGRMQSETIQIPIRLITNPEVGLRGSLQYILKLHKTV